MTFSTLIIGVAFLPLFTMTGVSGVIFAPMARTYAFAIGGAICLALTLTPVLASKVLPAQAEEKESAIMRVLHRVYSPAFDLAMKFPKAAIAFSVFPIVLCIVLFPLLGREFMPKLEEGNFWIRATLPMSISLDQSAKYVGRMRAILRGCPTDPNAACDDANRRHPEVLNVVSQLGRPDDGTDVSGFYNIEFFAPLKPFDEWPRGLTKEKLTEVINKELTNAFPGVVFNFSQYISDNVEEAISGVKGENSVKVYGKDLEKNQALAEAIVDVMGKVRGVADLGLFRSLGQPSIKITPLRKQCARYGLNTGDVDAVIQAAIGGRGRRARDDLSRGRRALQPRQVQRPRARLGGHDCGGADEDRRRDSALRQSSAGVEQAMPPLRFTPRMGGRNQRAARGRGSTADHHSPHVPAHHISHLQCGQDLARYNPGHH